MPIMTLTEDITRQPAADLVDLDSVQQVCKQQLQQAPSMAPYSPYVLASSPHPGCDSATPSSTSPSFDSAAVCTGCGYEIRDQYVLKVMEESWHESCLRCFACQQPLSATGSCFARDGHVYCREDHALLFGQKCGRCGLALQSTDLVFRCINVIFHANCFTCSHCNVKFKMGDEFVLAEGEPVCVADYHMLLCQSAQLQSQYWGLYELEASESNRKTPKRPRTILNAQQRRQFKAAFEKSAKPCRKVREQLAKETGLSVRVVQVWFQNQRAKMKKQQRKEQTTPSGASSSGDGKGASSHEADANKSDSDDDGMDSDLDELENGQLPSSICIKGGEGSDSSADALRDMLRSSASAAVPDSRHHLHPPLDVTPIDKLYNMHNTYFSFA